MNKKQFDFLVDLACEKMEVDKRRVMAGYRQRDCAETRWLIIRVMRIHYEMRPIDIARMWGLHHTSVKYALEKWTKACARDDDDTLQAVYQAVVYLICREEEHNLFQRKYGGGVTLYGIEEAA